MAQPKNVVTNINIPSHEEYISNIVELPVEVREPAVRPTLTDAFYVLAQALEDCFEDDLAASIHAQEIQGWMQNGGSNAPMAWKHSIILLEMALGHKLVDR